MIGFDSDQIFAFKFKNANIKRRSAMRNSIKATMWILAIITFFGVDVAWASNYYSVRDKAINLSVELNEVPAPFGQGTVITGSFRNEANGFAGTINTFYKSEVTGTQILEFSWDANGCAGKYFVVPIKGNSGGTGGMFQNQNSGNLVLNFIAGASCEGPLEKLKLVLGEGYYGNGVEENHVHISNQCPHNKSGNGGKESGHNNSSSTSNTNGGNGANVNINVNNGNTKGNSGNSESGSKK
jgi:hypothetical protein